MSRRWTIVASMLAALSAWQVTAVASAKTLAESMSVTGDSISRGFDATTTSCGYADEVTNNWATGNDHGTDYCTAGPNAIFSEAERLECAQGAAITIFNDSQSGAKMLDDFANQATNAMTNLSGAPAPRYVAILMGHNDACTSTVTKTGNSCNGDRDPNNYCRTTPVAFEREFRRGLDQLIQVPNSRILVMANVRVSELCNAYLKPVCGAGAAFGICGNLWASGPVDICKSLTADCSPDRMLDMYNTVLAYNKILERVTREYRKIRRGKASKTGATKASDVRLKFEKATFYARFTEEDVSCCDCFHPSLIGQAKLAEAAWSGLQCSETHPCCGRSPDPSELASCVITDTKSMYRSGFWPRALRKLVPPLP